MVSGRVLVEGGNQRNGRPAGRLAFAVGQAGHGDRGPVVQGRGPLNRIIFLLSIVMPAHATFSILGYDPATGELGGAVQSRVFSVGNGVLWAEAGVGAAATQAVVDVGYGPQALKLLKLGYSPERIVKLIHDSDPDPNPVGWSKEGRQFAVMDASGKYA